MADILSQEEVDLLLSAVAKGEVEVEEKGAEPAPPQEILTAYDFRRPERVSKEQLKGLQSLFEALGRELSIALPPFLRTVVRVDLLSIDQLTYDEFILSVSRPTSLAVINMAPLEGNAVIELSPSLVFPVVDRVLGGKGGMLDESRELTEIENRIVHRIVLMILECLHRAWAQLVEFKMTVVSQESDPLIVQIVAGSDMVILVGYEVHIGDAMGSMNLCIPLIFLNPLLDQITKQTRFVRKKNVALAAQTRARIAQTLRQTTAPVEAILGKAELNLKDIAQLQPGDVVQLDAEVSEPIRIEVGGVERFRAIAGRRGNRSAVQVVALVRPT